MHIVELQHELQEARNEINHPSNSSTSKCRPRTAAVDHSHDASELLELGVDAHEVSELCGMHPSQVARIQEYNLKRRRFLMTGNLDSLPRRGAAAGITGISISRR